MHWNKPLYKCIQSKPLIKCIGTNHYTNALEQTSNQMHSIKTSNKMHWNKPLYKCIQPKPLIKCIQLKPLIICIYTYA